MAIIDLIRPKWKNSDPKIRLEAVKEMDKDQMEILRQVARDDPDTDVKIAAVLKISDENFLKDLISENKDARLTGVIKEKLNAIRKDVVLKSGDIDLQKSVMAKIDDPALVCEIAIETQSPEIRLIAADKIDDPDLLCKITQNNCGLKTGLKILDKLVRAGHMENIRQISLKASSKKLRKKAKILLEPDTEKQEKHSPEKQKNLLMESLCKKLELTDNSISLSSLEKILEDAEKSVIAIDPEKKHPLIKRYESAREKLILRMDQIRKYMGLKEDMESLCKEAENLLSSDKISEKTAMIWQRWEVIGKHTDFIRDHKLLEERFLKIWDQLEEKKHREEKAEEEKKEKQKLLEICIGDIENLMGKAGTKEAGRKFKDFCAAWDETWFESNNTLELKEKFHELCARFEKAAKEYEKKEEEEKAAQKEKLLELCKKVEEAANTDKRAGLETRIKALQKEWSEAGNLIPEFKEELSFRFRQACTDFFTKQREYWEKLEWERWANYNQKEELCRVIEAVNKESRLENTGNIIMEARKRWRQIGPVSKKHSVEIWNRFNKACDDAYKRCLKEKELLYEKLIKIIAKKEKEASSFNWADASKKIKDIQAAWNLIGPLPQSIEKDLKAKFKSACDLFFTDLRVFYHEMDKQRLKNLELKKELCKEAETLAGSDDQTGVASRLKEIQKKWKKIGPIPKSEGDALWNRLQTACNTFFDRLKSNEPENLKKKEDLCVRAEKLVLEYESGKDMNIITRELMELQKEWKAIGPVPVEYSQKLWERFRRPCDEFFIKRKEFLKKQEDEMLKNQALKEKLAEEAEALSNSDEWKKTGEALKELRLKWKEIGPCPGKVDRQLWNRFNSACDKFFKRKSLFIKEIKDERKENLSRKKELCIVLEALSRLVLPEYEHKDYSPDEAAMQLRVALDLKQEVIVPSNPKATWDRAMKKVKDIQKSWKKIGPVPKEYDESIWKRFKSACDVFFKKPEKNNASIEKRAKQDE